MVTYQLATEWQLYLASLALASVIVCVAALATARLLRPRPAALRHGLLLCALILCAISPFAISVALIYQWGWTLDVNLRVASPETSDVRRSKSPRVAPRVAETIAPSAPAAPTTVEAAPPATSEPASTIKAAPLRPKRDYQAVTRVNTPKWLLVWPQFWLVLSAVWFLGVVACLVRLLAGHLVVRKLRRSLAAPAEDRLTRLLQESQAQVGCRRRVRLWESALAPAPLSFGVLRPAIVLPTALSPELDDEQLRLVLKHEVAHVARRDHACALVERVAQAFFWWNVALRRVNRRLAELREQICDDYASTSAQERRQLAEVLVKIAGWNATAALRVGAATALVDDARDDLAGRVTRLVENRPRSMHLTLRAAVGVASFACLLAVLLLLATLRAAPIERFERTPEQKALIAELQENGVLVMDDHSTNSFHVNVDDRRATDADVARLLELGPIGDLRLAGENLTDAALESVGRMSDLTRLTLGFALDLPISEKGLVHLKNLESLSELTISTTHLNDTGLATLKNIPHLFKLTLTTSSVSDAGLAHLPDFPELEDVTIAGSRRRISDDGLRSIARMPNLTSFSISSNDVTDAGLQALSQCPSLTKLSVQGKGFTDEGLLAIATIPNLTNLSMQVTGITADGIRHLKGVANLDTLGLSRLDDERLAAVGELVQLQRLTLNSDVLTDAGLEHLKSLTNLQSFEMRGDKFTGEGLKYMSPCQEINGISALGKRIGDEIFAPLNAFPKLVKLTVGAGEPTNRSRITDAGLSRLTSPSLEFASFVGTGLTEAGFESLDKLPNLRIAHFPWTTGIQPPFWNRRQARRQTANRPAHLPAKIARLSRPPLDDAKIAANEAIIAELKQAFGPRSVQTSGQRNHEPLLQIDINSPLLTDEMIGKIAGMANVHVCNLSGPNITDAGIAKLKDLQGVKFIRIGGDQLTSACLPPLSSCTEMTLLGLSSPNVTDEGLAALVALTKVDSLQLHLPAITDAGLVHLANMLNLQYLWFTTKQFTDEGVRNLAQSRSLKDVDLWSLELTDESLAALGAMPSLESVQLFSKKISDAGVGHLKRASNLRGVNFHSPRITDAGLAFLGEIPKLERIGLHDAPITDEGFVHLQERKEMTALYLTNCQATGAGLRHLADLKNVDNITFTGPAVNDSLFEHLAQFPKLRNLNAGRIEGAPIKGGISDEGLKNLVKCQELFSLYLDYTRVTDAGLAPLLEMPKLSSIQFRYSPGVTKAGIAELKEAMPSLSAGSY